MRTMFTIGNTPSMQSNCPMTKLKCDGDCMWTIIQKDGGMVCAIALIAISLAEK